MFNHNFVEMVDQLIATGVITEAQRNHATDSLKEYWKDKIALIWTTEDVLTRAKDIGVNGITEEVAETILVNVLETHDCNCGVTWESLDDLIIDNNPNN